MVGKVLIVLNGGRVSKKTLALWIASADHVIAADGGANALADAELQPNTVLGDFDSIRPGLENFFENAKFLPDPSQHSTDFQKSIRFAVESLGARKVAIIGAEGDRVDHLLSTFGTAAHFARKADIRFVLETMICYVVTGDSHFSVSPGKTVSLIPLPKATVTATGLEYPVENLSLSFGANDGVSNRAIADSLELTVHDGTLAVFIERVSGVLDW
ncbi:MAG: thiamine diphosphokinase [Fimbriimonadales bacterium]|nr:thiamine diphosphokinase [Fimbriimonadales bacterium]